MTSTASRYARRANPPSFVVSGGKPISNPFPASNNSIQNRVAIHAPHTGYRTLPQSIIKGPTDVKLPQSHAYEANANMRMSMAAQSMSRPQRKYS